MNQELANAIKLYSTGSHAELNSYLIGKSKDLIISIFTDLLTMYINDKNSSTIRELITVTMAGYQHKIGKIGYNGFKQDASAPGKKVECEAKPKNCDTHAGYIKKLNGGGNFTDYTFARFKRDKQANPNLLVSGFVDGRLIYILEFPFAFPDFTKNLKRQLRRRFRAGKDISGQFLRSANFNYKHFIGCPSIRAVYLLKKSELTEKKAKQYIVTPFYKYLEEKSK